VRGTPAHAVNRYEGVDEAPLLAAELAVRALLEQPPDRGGWAIAL
jgi:hypothetical protein